MRNGFLFLLVLAGLAFSCKNDRSVREDAANSLNQNQNNTATAVAVNHYICPNNCANSGGDNPGSCPSCGSEYLHNQAWHDQQPQTAPTPMPEMTPPTPTPAPTPEPAQNAAGIWHYVCSKGCAGGSGNPGACAKCGSELAHNDAYHN